MSCALVLNATFEPLSVVPARRAACLVLADKADIVADDGTRMHSARLAVPTPSVVRLRYIVRIPFQRAMPMSRRAVFTRDDHSCQYCGGPADSIDHIVPRSRGGEHRWDNVAAACRDCNLRKRDRTPREAGMPLARPARAPRHNTWVVVAAGVVPEAWKPYLALAS